MLAIKALLTWMLKSSFKLFGINEVTSRSATDSELKVPSLLLSLITGEEFLLASSELVALHDAPESNKAYVGAISSPADTSIGTMGRVAPLTTYAMASQDEA